MPENTPPGRLLLRLPPALHGAVQRAAGAAGLSVNEYCVRRLAIPGPVQALHGPWPELVRRAAETFDGALAGVVAHGSWVRGTAGSASDIDALVVLDPSVRLTRSIYATWDAQPLAWEGRPLDLHFVHLPAAGGAPSALWCEAAVEGLVIYERDAQLSRRLAELRRAMAEGRLVRKTVQGQPYWTVAA
ncbi:hypothetical protein BH23ACI1_BH23ACI1_27490 [soil metagenome]|nr:nucleotidyltransferase domain-containing protein [Acidobacteriota bacterium]